MATLKLTLDQRRQKNDGTFALVFRVRHLKKYFDISTSISVLKNQFDHKKGVVVKNPVCYDFTEDLREVYTKRLRNFQKENLSNHFEIVELKNYLLSKCFDEITIYEFWDEQIQILSSSGKNGNARNHKICLSVISKVINLKLSFKCLTIKDLLKLENELLKRNVSVNSISVYMRSLKAICNKAINLDYAPYDWYPFRKYKINKEKTTPRVISIDEIRKYFTLNLSPSDTTYRSWCIGKLIFLLQGINLCDLLQLTEDNIKGGRIIYKRSKTHKIYSIKILPETRSLLNEFCTERKTLLSVVSDEDLKDSKLFMKQYTQKRKNINSHLTKIGKILETNEAITTYVFRYSYANIAKQLGFSKDLIAEALGHNFGNTVTGIYLEMFDKDIVDNMNEVIIKNIMTYKV